ncbi:MAG: hypothetical protein E7C49_01000 [Clostridium sp.]|nr:hypothetical protein [Clostridium sp.]
MQISIRLKNSKESLIYKGDRIDILDYDMNGIKYKQIRCFKKGFSKSELILDELILDIKEIAKK